MFRPTKGRSKVVEHAAVSSPRGGMQPREALAQRAWMAWHRLAARPAVPDGSTSPYRRHRRLVPRGARDQTISLRPTCDNTRTQRWRVDSLSYPLMVCACASRVAVVRVTPSPARRAAWGLL